MGKEKGVFYEVLGRASGELYKLGYTGSKTAATKYYMEQGWKKKDLVFRKKKMKKKSPPKKQRKKR